MIRGLDSVSLESLVSAVIGSLGASVPAAFLSTSLVLPLVYLGVRRPSALSRLLERLAYIGYAIPPLAFGLSLIFFVQRAIPSLYQTLWVLIYAYTLHFMAEAIGRHAAPSIKLLRMWRKRRVLSVIRGSEHLSK